MTDVGPRRPVLLGTETPQEAARVLEDVVRLSGATARALAMRRDLMRRGSRWHIADQPLQARAPHVHPLPQVDDWRSYRGATDAVSLLVRHSDPALHARTSPEGDIVAELVFALLEQFRVESQSSPLLPGEAGNLAYRFTRWTEQVIASGLSETEQGLLIFTVAQVCRSRVLAQEIDDRVSDLIEATRFSIAAAIGEPLARLRATRHDQAAFAVPASQLARTVAGLVAAARDATNSESNVDRQEEDSEDLETTALSLLVGFSGGEGEGTPDRLVLKHSNDLAAKGGGYSIFTAKHDRCDPAGTFVPASERAALEGALDRLVQDSGLRVSRLAQAMDRSFAAAETTAWEADLEEGELDPSRLTRPVTRVGDSRVFRARLDRPSPATAVTILLDCSGSMKTHRERIAPLIQVWGRAMNRAGLAGELLGHTTRTWGGSLARRDWQRAGRPARPGRLTELQHFILRGASATRSRDVQAALLLRTSAYRESVDGEAILWAAERLRAIDARRHVLAVITDGAPMETSTARANDGAYLDHHLREVIADLDQSSDIELVGVGVGLDLSEWFSHYHVLDLATPLPHVASELLATLERPG